MSLRIGSMFSGAGGLDLAVAQVTGGKTVWVADVCGEPGTKNWPHRTPCKSPCTILAHRFPDIPNLGDVAAIDWTSAAPIDILCAGFPCQDVSTAGKRAGLKDGTRTGLWSEVVRAIEALNPRLVVLENVPGIFTADASGDMEPCPWCLGDGPDEHALRALDAVLADLATLGLDAEWVVVPASSVGAPHERKRWFLAAYPAGDPWRLIDGNSGIAAEPTDVRHQRSRDSRGRWTGLEDSGVADVVLLPTVLTKNNENKQSDGYGPNGGESQFDRNTPPLNTLVKMLPTPSVADTEGGRKGRSGDRSDELLLNGIASENRWGDYAPAIARWEQVLGRPAPSPTEPTGKNGKHQLSARFVEWMMSWTEGWVTDVPGITRNQALKAGGNGVVTLQAVVALRHLLERCEQVAA